MNNYTPFNFVAAFDCDSYGAGSYDEAQQCDPELANTGYDVLVPLTIGLLLIAASVVLLFKRLKRSKA